MPQVKNDLDDVERVSQEIIRKGKTKNIVIGIGVAIFTIALLVCIADVMVGLVTVFSRLFSAASVGFLFSFIPSL